MNSILSIVVTLYFSMVSFTAVSAEEGQGFLSSLELEHVYIGEMFSNLSGGVYNKKGKEYFGNLNISLMLDSGKAGLWKGTSLVVFLQNTHGKGITENYVGDLQVLSNIDAPEFSQVSEYYICQCLWEDRLKIKLGKQDSNVDFNIVECAGDFINSSFGSMPNVPLPKYPDGSLGAAVLMSISDRIGLSAGLFDGAGRGESWGFDTVFGSEAVSFSMLEGKLSYSPETQGFFKLGLWHHGGTYKSFKRSSTKSSLIGAYLIVEQGIMGNSKSQEPCINAFLQYSYSDKDISEIPAYFGAGLTASKFIPKRPDDSIGIGFAAAAFNPDLAGMKDETSIEIYYYATIRDWFIVQPDIQYILNPGGTGKNAFVTGVRFYLVF